MAKKTEDEKKAEKEKKKWEKLEEAIPGYMETVAGLGSDEVLKKLKDEVMCQMDEEKRFKEDPDVLQKKEELEFVAGPFKDNIKIYKLKVAYCALVLQSRGQGI